MTTMRVVAIIPAFNEEPTIAAVVRGLRDDVDHVLVVDDGSTDGTAAGARAAGAEVVEHGRNRGKGEAVRTALGVVAPRGFTHALMLDGDMQHLPSEAAALLRAAQSGADVVLGERQLQRAAVPAARYHANRWGSRVLSWFVGSRFHDTQCGFRVVRLDALRGLDLKAKGYDIETEMLVKLSRRGASITTVPVTAVYAGQPSKLRPVRDTTRTCFLAVYYRFIERM
jgi:glycosyltransferase involved in cell wall biosynthesis